MKGHGCRFGRDQDELATTDALTVTEHLFWASKAVSMRGVLLSVFARNALYRVPTETVAKLGDVVFTRSVCASSSQLNRRDTELRQSERARNRVASLSTASQARQRCTGSLNRYCRLLVIVC